MARRKRKRSSRRPAAPPAAPKPERSLRSPQRMTSEERNEAVRAALEPLAPGERPRAVTIAAIVAATLALANLIAYLAGVEIDGQRPELGGMIVYEALLLTAAVGMWRAQYWAVLGFQFMLGFLLVICGLLLTRASNLLGAVVVLAIGIPAGWLFWKLVRALARLQMPAPPSSRR